MHIQPHYDIATHGSTPVPWEFKVPIKEEVYHPGADDPHSNLNNFNNFPASTGQLSISRVSLLTRTNCKSQCVGVIRGQGYS